MGEIMDQRLSISIKTLVALGSTLIALSGHAATLHMKVQSLENVVSDLQRRSEEDQESLYKMEKTLCAMCIHLLGKSECRICGF